MDEQLVEAVARVIAALRVEIGGSTYAVGDYLAPEVARAALAAIEAEGYVVLPKSVQTVIRHDVVRPNL